LRELKSNQKTGVGARTLQERRAQRDREEARERAEGLTLGEFWETDYIHHLKGRMKESSWIKEVQHWERNIAPVLAGKTLKDITGQDVDRVLDRMRERDLSPRSQEYCVGVIRRIWKSAARRKLVKAGENPAVGVALPKYNNARLRVLTPHELKDILDRLLLLDRHAYDITFFAAFTGCRFSEAAGLTWEHVDFIRGTAWFHGTKNRDSRQVYLVPEILSMLEGRSPGGVGELVFTRQDGMPWPEPPYSFRRVVNALGLNDGRGQRDKVSFHSLRHTAATLAARRGTPLKDLQLVFGWKVPAMVFRYAHGNEDVQRRAMQGLLQSLAPDQEGQVIPFPRKANGQG